MLLGQEGKKVNKSKIMQPLNYIKLAFNGLWDNTPFYENLCLHNVNLHINKKYILEKGNFWIIGWPTVTVNALCLHNNSIHFLLKSVHK